MKLEAGEPILPRDFEKHGRRLGGGSARRVCTGASAPPGVERGAVATRLALLGVALVFGLAIAELALRYSLSPNAMSWYDTASPVEASRWIAHPFLPFSGRPNADHELKNGPERSIERIVTNSYGFRAHEFPTEKKPGDYFVFAFGGSTTYGYKVESNAKTWPELLEERLAVRYPDRNVRAFNMGIDMATTNVTLVNMVLVAAHLRPDLVIVYHGYNDLDAMGDANYRPDHFHFYQDYDPKIAAGGLQASLPPVLRKSAVARVVTGSIDLRNGVNDLVAHVSRERSRDPDRLRGIGTTLQNFDTMHALASGWGADIVFSTFQFRHDAPEHEGLNAAFRDHFTAKERLWVDQEAAIPNGDESLQVDTCHFTPKGRDLLVGNFYDYIVAEGLIEE